MTAALALRAELKAQLARDGPSVNDLLVKASALALREHRRLNGSYRGGTFERYGRINVGVDGADAAAFLATLRDLLHAPLGLLV